MGKALILTLDIETAPNVGLYFGRPYDVNIAKVVEPMYVFGFAYKWIDERQTRSCYIWDFPLYKKDPTNDIEVAKKWLELVSAADIVVGHNSRSFDDKIMLGRVMVHQLDPPIPFANVDTKTAAKRVAKFDSNKLDDLGDLFGIGRKKQTGGIDLWWDCMKGIGKAQKKMRDYSKQDVVLTEKLYLYERPYMAQHPAINVLEGKPNACTKCGSEKILSSTKRKATNSNTYQYFYCKECGNPMKARVADYKQSEERMKFVN